MFSHALPAAQLNAEQVRLAFQPQAPGLKRGGGEAVAGVVGK